jgi:hypothetical protein
MEGSQIETPIRRWQYSAHFKDFAEQSSDEILGELTRRSGGDLDLTQNSAWQEQIEILKALQLSPVDYSSAKIYFEYTIPRLGRRADVILVDDACDLRS